MKVQFIEYDGCFEISLDAENMQEAAALVRFGMNRTNELRSVSAVARKDGSFNGHVVFGKHKRASEYVPRRK